MIKRNVSLAQDLIVQVRQLGIQIRADVVRDRILCRPADALPPDLLQALRQHKAAVMTELLVEEGDVAHFDGSANPNPGGQLGMGWHWQLRDGSQHEKAANEPPHSGNTNNVGEYQALIHLLDDYIRNGHTGPLLVRGDSQLIINQVTGTWRCWEPALVALRQRVQALVTQIRHGVRFEWVPRVRNQRADALASGHAPASAKTTPSALPSFLTPARQRVLDTVRSLQTENAGQFVSFDDIERAIGTRLTHDQIAAGLTALVVADFVTRDERSHCRLDPRYGIGPAPATLTSPATSSTLPAERSADFEAEVEWRLALLRDQIPAAGPMSCVVVWETPDTKLPGHCSMCSEQFLPQRVSSPWRRCAPCAEALRLALDER